MKIIGLTGGIGRGKTTVLKMFKELGCATYVADIEAKKLMNSNKELVNQIKQLFGDEAYIENKLNTVYIAEIVFNDKVKLTALNALVHPVVRDDFKNFVKEEIESIKRRRTMTSRRGLIVYTRIVWNQIKFLMLKLNPSIEKVIITLENYDKALLELENLSARWFEIEAFDDYRKISELNYQILKKINHLCYYAYTNIYNETSISENFSKTLDVETKSEIINKYNKIHKKLIMTVDNSINQLNEFNVNKDFNLESKNQSILTNFFELLDK